MGPLFRRLGKLVPVVAFGALSACGPRPTASVQLVLTPDPSITSAARMAAVVRRLVVVVRSAQGLQGITAPGRLPDGGEARDVDGDGLLEAVLPGPAIVGNELPILQVDLRDNIGRELQYRAYGFASVEETDLEAAVAFGGASVSCPEGQVCKKGLPFNLKAAARPPRVILAMPADGTRDVPRDIVAVSAILSTTAEPDSVRAHSRVVGPDGSVASVAVMVSEVSFSEAGESALRTSITFKLGSPLPIGAYAIEVGPGIVSNRGLSFDQDPSNATEDGFVGHFVAIQPNSANLGCWATSCEEGYVCDEMLQGCVPVRRCASSPDWCPSGFVCSPAAKVCVDDCRLFGLCADAARTCSAASGLCQ